MKKYYLGIDPGMKTSPISFCIIEVDDKKYAIKSLYSVQPSKYILNKCMREIIACTAEQIVQPYKKLFTTIEEPFLKGPANKIMNKLIGALERVLEIDYFIAPTSVKKKITESGKATKEELARKLLEYPFDIKSKNTIKKLIEKELSIPKKKEDEGWDETDAIAITITGILEDK